SRVSMRTTPLRGAACVRLFCANCGKEQKWDVEGERAKPLPDPSAPDGLKRTKDGGRLYYDAKNSTCQFCGNMAMCNPLSAVCIYCDCVMEGFRPTYWKCTNAEGKARRRVLSGPSTAASSSTAPARQGSSGSSAT
ncbi:hypothetical protein Agub_g15702, partial [Astrephomene gubernaculifera]